MGPERVGEPANLPRQQNPRAQAHSWPEPDTLVVTQVGRHPCGDLKFTLSPLYWAPFEFRLKLSQDVLHLRDKCAELDSKKLEELQCPTSIDVGDMPYDAKETATISASVHFHFTGNFNGSVCIGRLALQTLCHARAAPVECWCRQPAVRAPSAPRIRMGTASNNRQPQP